MSIIDLEFQESLDLLFGRIDDKEETKKKKKSTDKPKKEKSIPKDKPKKEKSVPKDKPKKEKSAPKDKPKNEKLAPKDKPKNEKLAPKDKIKLTDLLLIEIEDKTDIPENKTSNESIIQADSMAGQNKDLAKSNNDEKSKEKNVKQSDEINPKTEIERSMKENEELNLDTMMDAEQIEPIDQEKIKPKRTTEKRVMESPLDKAPLRKKRKCAQSMNPLRFIQNPVKTPTLGLKLGLSRRSLSSFNTSLLGSVSNSPALSTANTRIGLSRNVSVKNRLHPELFKTDSNLHK